MKTCPVCANHVRQLGPGGDPNRDGIIVHTEGDTYVVHAACLMAFRDMLSRLWTDDDDFHSGTPDRDPPERPQPIALSARTERD